MLQWIKARWALVRETIAAGDVNAFERRYLPAALFAGVVVGVALSLLSSFLALVVLLVAGFGLGYASRAYVSYKRRVEYRQRRGDNI